MPYPPDLSDEELDAVARSEGASATWMSSMYLDEANRRSVDRQTRQSIKLTEEIRRLTSQIRWLTGSAIGIAMISVVIAILALVRPLG
jgi:hypothetical protein